MLKPFMLPPCPSPEDLERADGGVEYREIAGYPAYRVGSDGSVWSSHSGRWRRMTPVGTRRHGYLDITLCRDGKKTTRRVHKLVAEAFLGPCPPGMEVAHEDCNKKNARLSNLRYDTHKGNYADSVRVTHLNRGTKNGNSKLTDDTVRAIKRRLAHGEDKFALMDEFQVGRRCIERIWWGQRWGHIRLEGEDLAAERARKGIVAA